VTIGAKFLLRERVRMRPRRGQGQQPGCPCLPYADARVSASGKATLLPCGQTTPALQIQVVARQIGPTTAREPPGLETRHHAPPLLAHRLFVCQQCAPKQAIEPFALRPASGSGGQGGVDSAQRRALRRSLWLRFHPQASAVVEAPDHPRQ
jgi:hypothetical protein